MEARPVSTGESTYATGRASNNVAGRTQRLSVESSAERFRCASGRRTRPAAGPKHASTRRQPPREGRQSPPGHAVVPPVRCTLCPLRRPRGGRTLDCRTVVAPRPLTAPRPVQEAAAQLDRMLLRPTVVRAPPRWLEPPSPRAPECQSEPTPALLRRSDLYSSSFPSRPSAATNGYYPRPKLGNTVCRRCPGVSKACRMGASERLTRLADGEP